MADNHRALEACINEFFSPQTTNERKQAIEVILNTFTNTPDSWKQALFSLNHTVERQDEQNQYMMMYCLTILERTVKYRWTAMGTGDKDQLKSNIYAFLVQHATLPSLPPGSTPTVQKQPKCPSFVRNKIIKILTDVGKFDWPHAYPTYFTNIYQITQGNETVLLGLIFLKTISEEWPNVKDELSTVRRHELKSLLIQEVPKIFQLLHQILSMGLKHRTINPLGTTPPPSPSSSPSTSSQPTFHAQIDEIVQVVLEIVTQYSTWIPLDCSCSLPNVWTKKVAPFSVEFVQNLCQFALFDTCSSSSATGIQHSVQALGALNELLYRKFVPKEFDEQMNFICRFGVELLNKILNQSSISVLPDEYLEKFIEFLCLVASSHFHRYDEQGSKAFMSLLLPFTFKQEETAFYYECLEIWARLLDHLNAQMPVMNLMPNRENFLQNFKQPILGLAFGIVRSTAKFNVVLDECFDAEDDDDIEAPSLVRNIDVLVKIGELLPTESLENMTNTWAETCQFYINLKQHLNSSKTVTNLQIPNSVEIEHFHFIVQLIGRVASIFYGDVFKQELTLGKTLLQQLVLIYNFSKHFYHIKDPSIVISANCEITNALRSWTHWLSRYHSEVVLVESSVEDQQAFFEMLSTVVQTIFYTLENHAVVDRSILHGNVSFFGTFVNSIRTQFIFQMAPVQTLIQQIHSLKNTFDTDLTRMLHKIVATLLLLPWQSVSLQEWDLRTQLYSTYMKKLCQDLIDSASNVSSTVFYFHVITDQLELLMTECGTSKKMCWDVLKDLVPYLQKMSTVYLRQPGIGEEILNMFLKIMEVLRQQTGIQFFEVTIQGFLGLFSTENIINDLMKENESSSLIVEKFLQMLQYMIKDSSPSFRKFLNDTLALCYDHIYPILAQRSSPDLKIKFFQLQRDTLHSRWNYFFPTVILQQQNNSMPNSSANPATQDTKRLDQILQSIGHSFLQPDLEVFRFNLQTLTFLNEKHNLYQKLAPRPVILQQFITVLLQVLIQKTHDLLRDDIIRVVHEMSIVPSVSFQKTFLPGFIASNFPRQTDEQRTHLMSKFRTPNDNISAGATVSADTENDFQIDLPTFTVSLNDFIDDLRHFRFLVECQQLGAEPGAASVGQTQSPQSSSTQSHADSDKQNVHS